MTPKKTMLNKFLLLLLLVIGRYDNGGFIVYGVVDEYRRDDFPCEFVFGASSSAYQYEGAVPEDGRTYSIWDTYTHSGYMKGNGDVACDGYHKYKVTYHVGFSQLLPWNPDSETPLEDIQLMADTGLEAYRFSISWSRLIPNGGVQYYNDFINELISHEIQPHVTLFHSDLPQILEDEYGGWLSRKSVKDYIAYVDVCFREFGDRVLHWTTFNEPNIYAYGGYDLGITPPARCSSPFGITSSCTKGNSTHEPYLVAHHLLLAHASAVRLYRKKYKAMHHGFVGINVYAPWYESYTNTIEDVKATQRVKDFYLGWFVNPLLNGDYPEIMKKNAGNRIPTFTKLDSKSIKGSFDFLGINHYYEVYVKDNSNSLETENRDFIADMAAITSYDGLEMIKLPVHPWGLQKLLKYMKEEYGNVPIYIHENGQAEVRNGTLIDTPRVEYLHAYIGAVLDALRSFLDNFELLNGYGTGFGLYYVDMDDKELTRKPKLSAHWYASFLKGRNGHGDIFLSLEAKDSLSSSN